MPLTAQARWRPLVNVTVYGSIGTSLTFGRALLDPGADDTIFPADVAVALGISLLPVTGHGLRWRGQRFALRYGLVELELIDNLGNGLRWPATIAFSSANLRYPLLGMASCLDFLDAKFRGKDRVVEVEPNDAFPGLVLP